MQGHGQGAEMVVKHQRHFQTGFVGKTDSRPDLFHRSGLLAEDHGMVGAVSGHSFIKTRFIRIEPSLEVTKVRNGCGNFPRR